ncbi:uncharacterized protein [Ambystoma mexicanum]|uniref:uncharacterized protein isoform X2 n=1 Tax=Ambystoma mexicanum TaxID=8296 RepID=UPI0037E9A15C
MTHTPQPGSPSTEPVHQTSWQPGQDEGRNGGITQPPQPWSLCMEPIEQGGLAQATHVGRNGAITPAPQSASLSLEPVEERTLEQPQCGGRYPVMSPACESASLSLEPVEQRTLEQAQCGGRYPDIPPAPQSASLSLEPVEERTLEQAQCGGRYPDIPPAPQSASLSLEPVEERTLEQAQCGGRYPDIPPAPQSASLSLEPVEERTLEQAQCGGRYPDMPPACESASLSLEPVEQRTLQQPQGEGRQGDTANTPHSARVFAEQRTLGEEPEKGGIERIAPPSDPENISKEQETLDQAQADVTQVPSANALKGPGADRDGLARERTASFGRCVKFLLPPVTIEDTIPQEDELRFFHGVEQMLGFKDSHLKNLFTSEEWIDLTEDRLLRKRVLKEGLGEATKPLPGQEVTVQLLGIREDGILVEKDPKLSFILDDGDVIQALEFCVQSMQLEEESFLLTDALYAFGLLGRDPDIPTDASLLYNVTLLKVRDRPRPGLLSAADCISIGNQKRECGNFHFEREEYKSAIRSYTRALSILESPNTESLTPEESDELREHQIKCLNNMAATQLKLHLFEQVLVSCNAVLELDMDNVKALYRKGKAIHAELSRVVKRRKGLPDTVHPTTRPKARALLKIRGDLNPLLPRHNSSWKRITPWTMILGALVAMAGIVMAVLLTQER